jgi:hypothetical protein
MIGEAKPEADIGPSYYYLCRPCNYGFTAPILNLGTPLTTEQRRLAHIDSAALIAKSKSTVVLHEKLFPRRDDRQIRIELFPSFSKQVEEAMSKKAVGPSTEEVLEKARTLHGVIGRIEAGRQAEQNEEFNERTKPLLKYLRSEKLREERNAAFTRRVPARYGKNGRLESAGQPQKR